MILEQQILEVIENWRKKVKQELKPREISKQIIKNISKEIIDLVGVRRSGKSSLLFLIIRELGLEDDGYIYINFEDPAFIGNYNVELLELIWKTYQLHFNPKKKPYLFLDEIQNIPQWEQWVRKMRDLELAHIFVTGSSSQLLSREFGTKLTGRHISFRIYPLTFKEFLIFDDFKIPESDADFIRNKIKILKKFNFYFSIGGFPQIILSKNEEQLKDYFEDILYKDIVIRHGIRDVNLLRRLAVFCLTNVGKKISLNSIKKQLDMSIDSVKSYLSYLDEAFLIFQLNFFSYSLKKQEIRNKKIYCIDNGIRNAVSFKFSQDQGRLAENLVYMDLKKKGKDIFYWEDKNEVDFVVKHKDNTLSAINVSYTNDIDDREIRGLVEFKKKFKSKTKELIIITKDISKKEKGIDFIPLWKWVLQ